MSMKLVQHSPQGRNVEATAVETNGSCASDANDKKKENACSDLNGNSVIAKRYVTIKASDFSCLSPQSSTPIPKKPANIVSQQTIGSRAPCTHLENVQRPGSTHQHLKGLQNVQTKNQMEQNVRRKHEAAINNIANCKKTKALASRFIEPARHNPSQLPEDLIVGKSAFTTNRLQMEITDIGGTRLRQQATQPHNPQTHNNVEVNESQSHVDTSTVCPPSKIMGNGIYRGDTPQNCHWSEIEGLILGTADVAKTIFTSSVCSGIDAFDCESSGIDAEVESRKHFTSLDISHALCA